MDEKLKNRIKLNVNLDFYIISKNTISQYYNIYNNIAKYSLDYNTSIY